MTRNAESLKDYFNDKKGLNIVEADVSNSQQILKVMGSERYCILSYTLNGRFY
jgi:hypothetical protein